jgi:transcriptional regulator with XRE-family HTH domain
MQKGYVLPRRYQPIGKYLAEARNKAGLTQREVSLYLNYSSAQFISNFERGIAVPPLKKIKGLQRLYKLDIDKLIELILDAEKAIMTKALLDRSARRKARLQ